jgi:Acetyltransferase (GNAT) domain
LTNRQKYEHYCTENYVQLFAQLKWLDIACNNWQVDIFEKENHISFFIWHHEKKLGYALIRNPFYSPYTLLQSNTTDTEFLADAIAYFDNLHKEVSMLDVDINVALSAHIKPAENENKFISLHTNYLNLKGRSAIDLLANFTAPLKRQINKSTRNLNIVQSHNTEIAIPFFEQANALPDASIAVQLINYCKASNCGTLWTAQHKDTQEIVGAIWQVWDAQNSYYICGGTNKKYSEASAGLLWHAIQHAQNLGLQNFDFEGSSIKGIDDFFKKFGTEQKEYLRLSRVSKGLDVLMGIKKKLGL